MSPTLRPARAAAAPPPQLQAQDRGPTEPGKIITITVHLAKPDQAAFDRAVAALYDPASPTFHHWMTDADLRQFAPPEEQRLAVQKSLEANGLRVISTDKNGFSIRARGTVADMARAFNTEIHDFARNGTIFRRNISPATLAGSAAAYVHVVAGLESHTVRPMLTRARDLKTAEPLRNIALKKGALPGGFGSYTTPQSLSPSQTFAFPPHATYTGIVYGSNATLAPDFAPKQLAAIYNMTNAAKQNMTGAGQNIVLLEGYGYPTAESDANAEFKLGGVPALTPSNFSIIYPDGVPNPNAGIDTGWDIEIALDIQSSHSIAPLANTVVVATNGQDGEDFQYAMQYIIDNDLGTTVSDSWEEDQDLFAGAPEQQSYENILEVAAAKGISFQFSTGDGGDGGLGTPVGAPGVPSVAPHATAVGGTGILNIVGTPAFKPVSWGDGFSSFDAPDFTPEAGLGGGGGGGESVYWPKPIWQQNLPGIGRQTPDVSALADPYTGFPLVITVNGEQFLEPGWGGTSLASPIFTAIWAVAQQVAGGPLGQASPLLARLKTGLYDVVPLTNPGSVTGVVKLKGVTTDYSTLDLFPGVYGKNNAFVAGFWPIGGGNAIAFGLDTSLTTNVGWDNATGYGTPQNALAFIKSVVAAAKPESSQR